MAKDYYKTLGVSRGASEADIQKAYLDLARKYHPDKNPDDKTAKKKFQEIQAAFDVLKDAQKREMYDRYGSSFETMGSGGSYAGGWGGPGAGFGGREFDDFDVSQFFGQRRGGGGGPGIDLGDLFGQFRSGGSATRKTATRARRGADLRSELTVPFATAVTGGEAQIQLARPSGRAETLSVKIPAAIEDGKKIRLRGQGEPAPGGGTPGDLLITIRVTPHPCFTRQGNQLQVRVPVTLAEAALGAKVDVPTPKGTVSLSVPPGTSSGRKLRIKGHGVSPPGGPAGDLLAEILITLPDQIDEEAQVAIRRLDEQLQQGQNARDKLQW